MVVYTRLNACMYVVKVMAVNVGCMICDLVFGMRSVVENNNNNKGRCQFNYSTNQPVHKHRLGMDSGG